MNRQSLMFVALFAVLVIMAGLYVRASWLDGVFTDHLERSIALMPIPAKATDISDIDIKKDKIVFEDVKLDDKDVPNMIGRIEAIKDPEYSVFTSGLLFSKFVLADIQLGATLKTVDISSLFKNMFETFHAAPPFSSVDFYKLQMKLNSAFGKVNIAAHGIYKHSNDFQNTYLDAEISSEEDGLTFLSNLKISYENANKYTARYELKDGNINTPFLKGKILHGFFQSKHEKDQKTTFTGSIATSDIHVSDIHILEMETNAHGDMKQWMMQSRGAVQGKKEKLPISIEQNYSKDGNIVTATLSSKELDDLLNFLMSLKAIMSYKPLYGDILSPLMITEGNLGRVRDDVFKEGMDLYELQISGSVYDLSGKIVAYKTIDGTTSKHVVDLDPGTATAP